MTDFSKLFTLPLAEGNYPFKLFAEEMNLNGDDWAWLFLRLNPLYRHDYNLYRGIHSKQWSALQKSYRPGALLFPPHPVSNPPHFIVDDHGIQRFIPTSIEKLPKQLAGKDSRYFSINKEQLTGKLEGFNYTPITLRDYLMKFEGPIPFCSLALTDFEAPRTFGIATWIDPDLSPQMGNPFSLSDKSKDAELATTTKSDSIQSPAPAKHASKAFVLEHLPKSQSWFYLANEPLWQVNTWVVAPPKPCTFQFNGADLIVGTMTEFTVCKSVTMRFENGKPCKVKVTAKVGEPLPTIPSGMPSTEFHFLVCLDGYVKPQVDLIKPIANEFKKLHKKYYPAGVARGNAWTGTPIIFDPECKPNNLRCPTVGAYSSMRKDPNLLRRHWRQVTIDVAGPLNQQYKAVVHALEEAQKRLGDQLTFPVRSRVGNKLNAGDHWLKKALCAVELHTHGMTKEADSWYSQLTMRDGFYDPTSELYSKMRGKPSPTIDSSSLVKRVHRTKSREFHTQNLSRVRDALDNGKSLVHGWYEFIATMGLIEKVECDTSSKSHSTV
jgi:hypothetical protein